MSQVDDIEELHRAALQKGSTTYIDPKTGFTVFTELQHLRRSDAQCCGNACRHCPYGWDNVLNGPKRQGKLKSGDVEAAKRLLEQIEMNRTHDDAKTKESNVKTGGRHGGKFTRKNVPYTRGGDQGTSQLFNGERRSKTDDAFEALGTVDELCTVVGVAHAELMSNEQERYGELSEWLLEVMSRLFDLGTHVAKPKRQDEEEDTSFQADGVGGGFDQRHIDLLEDWIDVMTDELPELDSFILPTGGKGAAHLHVARTVCRRAERRVVDLVQAGVCDPNSMRYLNRLSDFFFTAARWVNYREGREEILYRRDYKGATQRSRQTISLKGVPDKAR